MKEHGLYKFVDVGSGEILYIGKTNNSFKQRINDHERGVGIDEKFNTYKGKYKVYIAKLPNSTETDILERALINQYKPVLNVTDNFKGFSKYIQIQEPEWIEYEKYKPQEPPKKKKQSTKYNFVKDKDIFIGELNKKKYWLMNTYEKKEKGKLKQVEMYPDPEQAKKITQCIIDLCKEHGTIKENTITIIAGDINDIVKSHIDKIEELGLWDGLRTETTSTHEWLSITTCITKHNEELKEVHFCKDTIEILSILLDN